ncbi:MAG: response regulator [Nitrospinae bacterium]|nr:response regulator [Nitrospinota bacterium]
MKGKEYILAVDDDHLIHTIVQKTLKETGYEIVCCTTGKEAIDLIKQREPTLLLLDYQLPDMLGSAVIKILKIKGLVPPFLVMTSMENLEISVEMMQLGALDYLVKGNQNFIKLIHPTVKRILRHIYIEEEMNREKEMAQKYLDIVGVILLVLDAEQRITLLNKEGYSILGYKEGELTGKNWFDACLPNAIKNEVIRVFEQLMNGKGTLAEEYENVVLTKTGEEKIVHWKNTAIRGKEGEIISVLSSGLDVTEKRKAEKQLLHQVESEKLISEISALFLNIEINEKDSINIINNSLKRLSAFFNASRCYLLCLNEDKSKFVHKAEWCSQYIDQKVNKIKEISVDDLPYLKGDEIKRLHKELDLIDIPIYVLNSLQGLLCVETITKKLWEENDIRTLQVIGEIIMGALMIERIEHDKKMMEIKAFSTSKLATLGEVATGVAHEINQPLTYISCFFQNLEIELMEGNELDRENMSKKVIEGNRQVGRIITIINHLRTFGREEIPKKRVSIKTIIDNSLLLIGERIRLKNITLNIDTSKNSSDEITGNANQLEQVFINLFQNAIDSFTQKKERPEITLNLRSDMDKNLLIIEFSDNGCGMAKDTCEKIFEPFFTTKEVGKGTGLGLSIVYGIIHEHGGTITCNSTINEGTTFTITFPYSPPP